MKRGLSLYQRDSDGVMRKVGKVLYWADYGKSIKVAGKVYTLLQRDEE
jgi:hypothetical protein